MSQIHVHGWFLSPCCHCTYLHTFSCLVNIASTVRCLKCTYIQVFIQLFISCPCSHQYCFRCCHASFLSCFCQVFSNSLPVEAFKCLANSLDSPIRSLTRSPLSFGVLRSTSRHSSTSCISMFWCFFFGLHCWTHVN